MDRAMWTLWMVLAFAPLTFSCPTMVMLPRVAVKPIPFVRIGRKARGRTGLDALGVLRSASLLRTARVPKGTVD